MLLNFRFKNFLSYGTEKETTFSMLPSQVRTHRNHLAKDEQTEQSYLTFAALFGANAAGKSNFTKAIMLSRDLVLNVKSKLRDKVIKECFNLAKQENSEVDSYFEYDILVAGSIYTYGFELNLASFSFKKEWLYKIENQADKRIFEVEYTDNQIELELESMLVKEDDLINFEVYKKDFHKSDSLFLTYLNRPERKVSDELDIYLVYGWFDKVLELISMETKATVDVFKDDNKEKLVQFLNCMGTGIESIAYEKVADYDMEDITPEQRNRLKEFFIKKHEAEQENSVDVSFMVRTPENIYFINLTSDGSDLLIKRLLFKHEHSDALFPLRSESEGTKRLIDIFRIINASEPKVFIVDELDQSLHPMLTRAFVKEKLQNKATQMIVSTHESQLLDLNLLRRDEIWLVKKEKSDSYLYSLEEFKVRFDKDILKSYLIGQYGSIPVIKMLLEASE